MPAPVRGWAGGGGAVTGDTLLGGRCVPGTVLSTWHAPQSEQGVLLLSPRYRGGDRDSGKATNPSNALASDRSWGSNPGHQTQEFLLLTSMLRCPAQGQVTMGGQGADFHYEEIMHNRASSSTGANEQSYSIRTRRLREVLLKE